MSVSASHLIVAATVVSSLLSAAEETVIINGREVQVQVQAADPNEPSPAQTMFGNETGAIDANAAAAGVPPADPVAAAVSAGGGSSGGSGASAAAPRNAVIVPQPSTRTPAMVSIGAVAAGGMQDARGLPAVSAGSNAPARPEQPFATKVLALDAAQIPQPGVRDLLVVALTAPDQLSALVVGGVQESGGVESLSSVTQAKLAAPAIAAAVTWPKQSQRPLAVVVSPTGAVSLLPGAPGATNPGAAWAEAIATPLTLAGATAIAAAQGDIDGDGSDDLVVAGLAKQGEQIGLSYAVGIKLDASLSPTAWSAWMPVAQALPTGLAALSADVAQTTLNKKPEILLHLMSADGGQVRLRTLVGVNATPTGSVEGWIARDQDLGAVTDRIAGLGTAAWKDSANGTDVALFWAEQAEAGAYAALAVLNNLPLAPPYKPTKEDLEAKGDAPTDLSVAAVKAQLTAGIRSPYQLKARIDPMLAQLRLSKPAASGNRLPKSDVLPVIAIALDQIEPKLPDEVRPELTRMILVMYGYDPEVGL